MAMVGMEDFSAEAAEPQEGLSQAAMAVLEQAAAEAARVE